TLWSPSKFGGFIPLAILSACGVSLLFHSVMYFVHSLTQLTNCLAIEHYPCAIMRLLDKS
ncbi:hypothetical protein, partial [Enterovibrio norvegicus]|uniref:hypothetical protein n=1 Tax=Enterovibrio norvegicus TaxID=188144 RepID=UPI001A7E18D5